uniref:Uncharacterized protein n=1 Tax=Anopheles melas TaxID=34690 RepID=A0A182TGT1_9DIPT
MFHNTTPILFSMVVCTIHIFTSSTTALALRLRLSNYSSSNGGSWYGDASLCLILTTNITSIKLEGAALSSLSPFAGEEDVAEEVDSVPVSPGTVAVLDTAVVLVVVEVVSFPSMLCVSVVCPGVVDVVLQKLLLEAPSNWYTVLQAEKMTKKSGEQE